MAATASAAAGLATAGALEPWAVRWLAPLGVALFVGLLLRSVEQMPRAVTVRRGLALGLIHGTVSGGIGLWWLWSSIAPAAWVALTAVHGAWGALGGAGVALVVTVPGRAVWVAAVLTTVEVLRSSWPFGGLPWARLAHAALDAPWQGLLAWVGLTGTAFVTALFGCAVSFAVRDASSRLSASRLAGSVGFVVAVGTVAVAASAWPPLAPAANAPAARAAVVQGGVPGDGTDLPAHHRAVTDRLVAENRRLAEELRATGRPPPDLVLWPENATATDVIRDARTAGAVRTAVADAGTALVLGSVVAGPEPGTLANTSVVLDARGPGDRYVKQNLVPFGEYVPFRPVISRLLPELTREIRRDMVPGASATALRVGGWRVATALCFDVAHADPLSSQVRGGADVVAVQTSNAMFFGTTQPDQQWAITRVRAVELGRAVAVASTNGVSGAIGPDGEVLARFGTGGAQSEVVALPVVSGLTPAVAAGPWPERAIMIAACVGLGCALGAPRSTRVARVRRRRRWPGPQVPAGRDDGRCPPTG